MSSLFFESPTSKKITTISDHQSHENDILPLNLDILKNTNTKKRTHIDTSTTLVDSLQPALSPSKRLYLHNMSPNVTNKHIYLQPSKSSSSKSKSKANPSFTSPKRESRINSAGSSFLVSNGLSTSSNHPPLSSNSNAAASNHSPVTITTAVSSGSTTTSGPKSRFVRPPLLKPLSLPNPRSQSSMSLSRNSLSPTRKLRRTNSLISQGGSSSLSDNQQQSATTSSDRFIPSRHNSTNGKLQSTTTNLNPNSSPQSHIKAQTSKLYQHHVAEACGIEMNSRILMYQPLPPERKRPVNLFNHISGNNTNLKTKLLTNKSTLRPAIASARAKKIPTAPERVLDAPGFVDDFYLNLLAWSSTNLLAIGLEDAVYVWNASTGSVGILCELPDKTMVTSLRWSDDGSYISIGKEDGLIEIWDIESNTKLRTINCENHQTRIASQSWNNHMLTSGSRTGNIYHSDVRLSHQITSKAENIHTAEICGLEYRSDGIQFASGGNDNLVSIWDVRQSHSANLTSSAQPLFTKTNHKAAVKALSWCPYQPSLLATGGGSSDKTINFWNTTTGARVNTIETGSQISSLNWGYANGIGLEIVATHGFPSNNISIYNYPTLQKTGEIIGAHDSRILNGCLSPDNLTLATVAGDENLKFWSLFDIVKHNKLGSSDGRINDDYDNEESDLIGNDDTKTIRKMMSFR